MQLQQLRWKGAKNAGQEYKEKSCARCQRVLGRMVNRGAVCQGCSHRVCSECRVGFGAQAWECTVCYALGEIKVKTGEWFFEERAKKFPNAGKHETAGAQLLESYQKPSMISVVPPTPPPFSEKHNAMVLGQSKGFNKSLESVFLSLSTQVKKLSKSQSDMPTADKFHLSVDYGLKPEKRRERRSQSDTEISITSRIEKAPHLLKLVNKAREEDSLGRRHSFQGRDSSPKCHTALAGGVTNGSLCSISNMCPEASTTNNASITGEIELSINFDFKASVLELCIKACKNLAYGDEKRKKCNPYVKAYLLSDKSSHSKQKTSLKKNTLDPSFNETLKYHIDYSLLANRMLQISVWHAGTLKRNVFLGEVLIPLESWNFEDHTFQSFNWYQLRAKPTTSEHGIEQYHGELTIQAKLIMPSQADELQHVGETSEEKKSRLSADGELHLIVHSAKSLPLRSDGTVSAFVRGCLLLPNRPEIQVRCPVIKKQVSPQWRHTCVFRNVSPMVLEQSCLELTVWDQASFGTNDRFLGCARLCTNEPTNLPEVFSQHRQLWQRILGRPNEWTEETLMLSNRLSTFKS